VHEWPNVFLQGLELLVTVLLARNRQPSPTVAAGVPHANLAAELISLPSGPLAMVGEAILKLKVRHGAAGTHASGGVGPYAEEVPSVVSTGCSSGFRCGPSRPRPAPYGPVASEFALSTLRAGASS
jgi:hypothetical protein